MSSDRQPRLWTYGDITIDASRIESVYVERDVNFWGASNPPWRDESWMITVEVVARLTSGSTYTLAARNFKARGGLSSGRVKRRTAEADDWGEKAKAEIMAELNAFLSKAEPSNGDND